MLVLKVAADAIDVEMAKAQRQVDDSPTGWSGLARVGKLLRFAGDRSGLDMLRHAAQQYLATARDRRPSRLVTPANLFRLAGEHESARELWSRVHDGLAAIAAERGHSDVTTGVLVDVCFLLGRDAEAVDVNAALARAEGSDMSDLRHPVVADLARARTTRDAALAGAVVAWFDGAITKEDAATSFSGTGGINLHDWLEIALVVQSELVGQISPRLREI